MNVILSNFDYHFLSIVLEVCYNISMFLEIRIITRFVFRQENVILILREIREEEKKKEEIF